LKAPIVSTVGAFFNSRGSAGGAFPEGLLPCAAFMSALEADLASAPLDSAPALLASAMRARGFERLTPVQEAVLAPEVVGRDLRISSQTGSGKTVAIGFLLAETVAEKLERVPGRRHAMPRGLVIAPTRELAVQLGQELEWLYADVGARVGVVTGGVPMDRELRILANAPDLVVGTPGRMLDHLRRKSLSLESVHSLVLDEADELLDMGFEEDLLAILGFAPEERRTHLVSATFAPAVVALADRMQDAPMRIEGTPLGAANVDIDHVAVLVGDTRRTDAVVNLLLLHPEEKTLVFVRTRADTADLAESLAEAGFSARALHGDMTPRERTTTFHDFRSGGLRVLVATDVAARGLDVQDVTRVVQVDLPESSEVFTHRSGRTGRAGRRGTNLLLIPEKARARANAILRGARVKVRFETVPDATAVLEAADARLGREVAEAPPATDERMRRIAEGLLEGKEPADVVAFLLERSKHAGPCAPRPVAKPRSERAGGFVTYQVNWGADRGADARRLLAIVCRRGGLGRADVGSIRIGARSSSVDVVEEMAPRFDAAVRRPDRRDPDVRFRRWQAGGPPERTTSGSRPPARRAPATSQRHGHAAR
jgi:ATP-dependent RNA helicase DeaD